MLGFLPLAGVAFLSAARLTNTALVSPNSKTSSHLAGSRPGDELIVRTTSGVVHGAINESVPHVRQWLGIPFAQAPVGELRFALPKPLPHNASSRHLSAGTFGPNCPQYESTTPSVYNQVVREFFVWGSNGDNCLTVSIWAPARPVREKLPVFLWIYGGGDTTGGSSVPYQNPSKWVQRTQSHIVVSLQYRLNFFGSPNAPFDGGAAPLSYFDTRLAMEWARDNIANFGGDPEKMVLWGQSAGAGQVGAQSFAWIDDPIVIGYIQESGASIGGQGNDSSVVACMRDVPQADIESYIQYWVDAGRTPGLAFSTKPDNETSFQNYTAAYLDGHYNGLPKIIAHCQQDGVSLVSYPDSPMTTGPNQTEAWQQTLHFRCAAAKEAEVRASLNLTSYRYMYSGNFSNISPLYWMGAYHSSELPMIHGTYADYRGPASSFQRATSETMQDMYMSFVQDPENGPAHRGWPQYSSGQIEILGGKVNNSGVTHHFVPKGEIEDVCQNYTLPDHP